MRSSIILPILFGTLLFSQCVFSREINPLDSSDIKKQFNYLIKKSTQYNDYRAVKSSYLYTLRAHVFDTIDALKSEVSDKSKWLTTEIDKNDSLSILLASTSSELEEVVKVRDSIRLAGIPMSKAGYNGLMWTLTIILLNVLILFVMLFKRSNVLTKRIKRDLIDAKEELELNRRKAREREEKIVRKLHDEINRYKKKVYQLEKSTQS